MPGHPVAPADTERVGNDIKQVRSVCVRVYGVLVWRCVGAL